MIFAIAAARNASKTMNMKKALLPFLVALVCSVEANGQNSAAQAALHLTQRLTDSLGLSAQQKNTVYDINLNLNSQKQSAKQQYQNRDVLKTRLQEIESRRDSLYLPVLSPSQMQRYAARKLSILGY